MQAALGYVFFLDNILQVITHYHILLPIITHLFYLLLPIFPLKYFLQIENHCFYSFFMLLAGKR